MKKLLVLSLVLAMASVSTAGLTWLQADNGDGTFTLTLTPTESTEVSAIYINALSAAATGISSSLPVGLNNLALVNGGKTYRIDRAVSGVTDPRVVAGGNLLTFTVTGVAGDVISILDGNNGGHPSFGNSYFVAGAAMDFAGQEFASVTLVPEPATMALLGLGVLALRRRK